MSDMTDVLNTLADIAGKLEGLAKLNAIAETQSRIVDKQTQRLGDLTEALLVTHIATLTHLLDTGVVTREQAAQRLEFFQETLPERNYETALISQIIASLRSPDSPSGPEWTSEVILGGLQIPNQDEP